MKKVIEFVKHHEPQTPEQEIKRAYWREAKQAGIGHDAGFHILNYLKSNNLTKPKA